VCSSARGALGVSCFFGDDALGYFTERLNPAVTRAALATTLRRAKRHKAFDDSRFIGGAVDGTTVGRCRKSACELCRPFRNWAHQIAGYRHHWVVISVAGTGLTLPFDVEPYGPGDSEYAAGQRRRGRDLLGARFADYVVVDGEFATAPFLHTVSALGLRVVARLKDNLPQLLAAAQQRFHSQLPHHSLQEGSDRVEIWDADDFDPWDTRRGETVRVFFYRQHQPDGKVVEAFWLTDFPSRWVRAPSLYHMAKSRGEIENQGFNDAKSRHGLEPICPHHPNSLLVGWLLVLMALTLERLYRLRYLHRGNHPLRTAEPLVLLLWLSLSAPLAPNTS
jgi:hypothetical protein